MYSSYKYWYITKADDGHIIECAVKFYEGEMVDDQFVAYRRLRKGDLAHLKDRLRLDGEGKEVVVYTEKDFGRITEKGRLDIYLNGELSLDTTRRPIKEQT